MPSTPPLQATGGVRKTPSCCFIKNTQRTILIPTPKSAHAKSCTLRRIRRLPGLLQLLEEHQVGDIRRQHHQFHSLQHAALLHMRPLDLTPSAIRLLLQCSYPQVLLHDVRSLSFSMVVSGLVPASRYLLLLSKRMSALRFPGNSPRKMLNYRQAGGFSAMLWVHFRGEEPATA